ncbi:MAG: ATP-binding cassette domain-containing protein, partial [Collinsella sp.]
MRPGGTVSLTCSNITVRHPEADTCTLSHVSLEIRPGSVIGIVGASGSGKSTLLRVLAGALAVQAGSVVADGTA